MNKNKKPRILLWDLECSGLNANFGFIICAGYKFLGDKKPKIISITNSPNFKKTPWDDAYVVHEFKKVLESADAWVTWYGTKFDVPYMQTRLLINGLPPVGERPHIDGWKIARYKLKFHSNRLDVVSKSLPIAEGEVRRQKTPVEGHHWVRAAAGSRGSIRYIEDHCRADIEVLESAYLAIRPFATSLPNLALLEGKVGACPSCGGLDIRNKGFVARIKQVHRRWVCKSCGHNFYSSK